MNDKPLLIVWRACDCYIWPIAAGYRVRPCGYCGELPERLVDEPASGRAEPIEGRY